MTGNDVADLTTKDQRARAGSQQGDDASGDLGLLLEVEEVEEGAGVDDVDLAGELLDEVGVGVEDVGGDEMGVESVLVEEEVVAEGNEVETEIGAVEV